MSLLGEAAVKLPDSKIDDAARLLARAFWDDPLTIFLFPDSVEREELSTHFYALNIEHALIGGRAYTTPSFKGIAVWRFFGDQTKPANERTEDPRKRLPEAIGAGPFQKLVSITKCIHEMRKGLITGRHCYLLFLGVEPGQQGMGIGSLLVKPVLKMADQDSLPCYLETMKEKNLAFYRKHGFQVGDERQALDGGPYIWALVRRPNS